MGIVIVCVTVLLGFAEVAFAGKTFSTAPTLPTVNPCATLPSCARGSTPADPRWDRGASAWQMEPWTEVVHNVAATHEVPLWSPYQGAGAPLAGNMQSAVFDPVLVAMRLRPTPFVQDMTFLLAFMLTGCAAYAFARSLRLGVVAATVAGGTFGLSGWFLSYSNNQWAHTYLFLPLALALVEWTLRSRKLIPPALLAVSLTMMILAGMPEIFFVCFVAIGTYSVVRLGVGPRVWSPVLGAVRLTIGGIAGVLLAAPALLVFAEYLPLSQNTHTGTGSTSHLTASLVSLLDWIAPEIAPSPGSDYLASANIARFRPQLGRRRCRAARGRCTLRRDRARKYVSAPSRDGGRGRAAGVLESLRRRDLVDTVVVANEVAGLRNARPRPGRGHPRRDRDPGVERRNGRPPPGRDRVHRAGGRPDTLQVVSDRDIGITNHVFLTGGWPLALGAAIAVIVTLFAAPRRARRARWSR